MANTIRIKRRLLGGSVGAPSLLYNAELAFNENDETLYIGVGVGGANGTASAILPIAGPGSFITKGTAQAISGAKTFDGQVTINSNTKVNSLEIYSGNVTSNSAIVNLFLGSETLNFSANTGTTTINNSLYVKGALTLDGDTVFGGDLTISDNIDSSAASVSLFGSSTSIVFGETASNVSIGASLGALTINSSNTSIAGILSVASDTIIGGDLIVTGDLTVNGTLTAINSTTVTVDDKNLELGSTQTPTNDTADGGGITLKGTTDKTIIWSKTNSAWNISENVNLGSGKTFSIDGVSVLSSDTLGDNILYSSLTRVGTITSGVWKGTTLTANNGGTGFDSYSIGDILYAGSTGTLAKLTIGSEGQLLQVHNGVPIWVAILDGGDF